MWVMVLTTWMVINGANANVMVEPLKSYPSESACQKALVRETVIASLRTPVGYNGQLKCVSNGI